MRRKKQRIEQLVDKAVEKAVAKAIGSNLDQLIQDAVDKALANVGREEAPTEKKEVSAIRLEAVEAVEPLDKVEDPVTQREKRTKARDQLKMRTAVPDVHEILGREEFAVQDVEDGWRSKKISIPGGLFILVGLFVFCLGGWVLYEVYETRSLVEEVSLDKLSDQPDKEKEDAETLRTLANMQSCVRKYLAAGSASELTRYIRHPHRVAPMVEAYYKKNKRWRYRFSEFTLIRSVSMGRKSFVFVVAKTEDGAARKLFLEQGDDGIFRVDWESDVIYQPVPWKQYLFTRPLAAVDMRVLVQEDHFYGFAFRDMEKYQCYKITAAGSDDYLFGYVERGSDVARQIGQFFNSDKDEDALADEDVITTGLWNEGNPETHNDDPSDEEPNPSLKVDLNTQEKGQALKKPQPMILRLRFLRDDPSSRCVKIDALMAKRWMYENSPEPVAKELPALAQITPPIAKPSIQLNPPFKPFSEVLPKKKNQPLSPPAPLAAAPPAKKDPVPAVAVKTIQPKPKPTPTPTATLKEPAAEPQPAKIDRGRVHIVKRGDSLSRIAKRYRVSMADIMKLNGIKNPNKLSLKQKVKIPAN